MEEQLLPPTVPMLRRRIGTRIILWLSYLFLAVALCAGGLLTHWALQSSDVLEVRNVPFAVRPGTNQAGQVEFMTIDYCKHSAAIGTVLAQMVGTKSVIRIPWPVDNTAAQCLRTEAPIPLPIYAADDTYYFNFTVTYTVNPLKKKMVIFRSQSFTIQAPQKVLQ